MAITSFNTETDWENEQFKNVDADIAQQENEFNQTYGGMINNTDQYYNDLKDATQQWADKQTQLQQDQTDFAIEKIEQQKDQAHKDYLKEQSGAYTDWRKQSNQYGVEAEKMASAGLSQTGFSESSQVSMYNTYQNRVATARESYQNAVLNYNNAIKDATLQNNAALAEIAFNSLQQQLELSLQGFQYKNQLVLDLADKKMELNNIKWNRYQDILQQLNTEKALELDIQKHNDTQVFQKELAEIEHNYALKRDEINNQFTAEQNRLDREHAEKLEKIRDENERKRLEIQHKNDLEKLRKQQEYALAQLDKELANDKALYAYQQSYETPISGGSSYSVGSSPSTYKKKVTQDEIKIQNQNKKAQQTANYPIDMNSVLALGYGPISESKLDQLVSSGQVVEYVEGGKTKFRKNILSYSQTKKKGTNTMANTVYNLNFKK
jgi:hypothetical protein